MEADVQALLSRTKCTPDLKTRAAMAEDAMTMGRLYAQAYFELMDQLPPPKSGTLEDFTKMMTELFIEASKQPQKGIFKWIAECSGCPVGFLITKMTEDHGGYVGEIGVLPSHRRKGIAQALLHRFAKFLKDRKVHTIELDVNIRNIPAIELYISCGFKKARTAKTS